MVWLTPNARDRRQESSTSGRAPPGSSRPTDRTAPAPVGHRRRRNPNSSIHQPDLTGRPATVVVRYCRSAAAGRMTATKTDTVTVSLRHAGACLPLSRDAHVKPPHFCVGWLMPCGGVSRRQVYAAARVLYVGVVSTSSPRGPGTEWHEGRGSSLGRRLIRVRRAGMSGGRGAAVGARRSAPLTAAAANHVRRA